MMAEIPNALIYDVLKQLKTRMGNTEPGFREMNQEMVSIRGPLVSIQTDIRNVYDKLDRPEERLERIERRLELRELSEQHIPYEPHP